MVVCVVGGGIAGLNGTSTPGCVHIGACWKGGYVASQRFGAGSTLICR